MKFQKIVQKIGVGLLIIIPIYAIGATEEPERIAKELVITWDKVFDPDILSVDSIEYYEPRFDFDWNNYSTIEKNRKRLEEIRTFLKAEPDFSKLSQSEQQALGLMLYKLGTFYTHVFPDPDLAIQVMDIANKYLKEKQDQAWNYNHLAFAYELKSWRSNRAINLKKGYYYSNKVLKDFYHRAFTREVAFAYCIQGILSHDEKKYALAKINLETALKIYQKIPGGKDDQYARTKNRLAKVILDMNGHDPEALTMLQEVRRYWQKKSNYQRNPYAARNLMSLGKAYLKMGNIKDGTMLIKNSIYIYENVYGKNSKALYVPLKLLSQAHQKQVYRQLREFCGKPPNEINSANLLSFIKTWQRTCLPLQLSN